VKKNIYSGNYIYMSGEGINLALAPGISFQVLNRLSLTPLTCWKNKILF
jgi:hypothetical protein